MFPTAGFLWEGVNVCRQQFGFQEKADTCLSIMCFYIFVCFTAREAFEEAGNILSGHVTMGMYFEDDALAL